MFDKMSKQEHAAMTTTATSTTTSTGTGISSDIQWERDEGNEKSDDIIEDSKPNSCHITQALDNSEIVADPFLQTTREPENLLETIANDSEINNDTSLKRKVSNTFEEISTIPVESDLNEEKLQENVTTNSTTSPLKPDGNNKRARRVVPSRISWEERIAALVAYKEEYGDLQIPIRYKKNPSLGKFVHNTREQYKLFQNQSKSGYQKRCSLTNERIIELNRIGFIWTTERIKKQNDDWNARLEQLKEYKARHGVSSIFIRIKNGLMKAFPTNILFFLC
jgi:Helicase associated domain